MRIGKKICLLAVALVCWSAPCPLARAGPDYSVCRPPGLEIGPELRVLAVGAYGPGESLTGGAGHNNAGLYQVAVNSPERPVLLILSAYEPVIWQIGWTEGTLIKGLMVTGYHRPIAAGLPAEVPVSINYGPSQFRCPYFRGAAEKDYQTVSALAGRPPDQLLDAGRQTVAGDLLLPDQEILTFGALNRADYDRNWPAEAELLAAVRRGQIKPASARDFVQWVMAAHDGRLPEYIELPSFLTDRGRNRENEAFVLLDPDYNPPVSGTGRSYIFFLPPGFSPPENAAVSAAAYLRLKEGDCLGPPCARLEVRAEAAAGYSAAASPGPTGSRE